MNILGINSYHESASAAIVCDGRLVAACEEERFNRMKYWGGFPAQAVRYCLKEAGIKPSQIDHIAIPRNPYAHLGRKLWFAMHMPSFALKRTKDNSRFGVIPTTLESALDCDPAELRAKVHHMEHHRAHMASAFFVSPFDEAAVFSIDSLGDFASCMWGSGKDNRIRQNGSVAFPHSLGMYYSAVSQYLGFPKFGDEYKVMGLAAYGEPEFLEAFRDVVKYDAKNGGYDFRLGMKYFIHHNKNIRITYEAGKIGRGHFGTRKIPSSPHARRDRPLDRAFRGRSGKVP